MRIFILLLLINLTNSLILENKLLYKTNRNLNTYPKKKEYNVGIVGATGAVGQEIIKCLQKIKFPVSNLNLYTSKKSADILINTDFGNCITKKFDLNDAKNCDLIFLAVSGDFSKKYAEKLCENEKTIVIDNSSAFRYDDNVPLVIPEINKKKLKNKKLIANPNCTTSIALMALYPIFKCFGLSKVIMSTYQAASGAGNDGISDLKNSIKKQMLYDKIPKSEVFSHPLGFNVIPHIDEFQENLYTKEEMKVVWEIRKILDSPDLPISCTAVRIPTIRAHSEAITVETLYPINYDMLIDEYAYFSGVNVVDDPSNNIYPMPLTSSKKYDVEVGRIRENLIFGKYGLDMFVSGDQLLRGAALNAVLIAKSIIEDQ